MSASAAPLAEGVVRRCATIRHLLFTVVRRADGTRTRILEPRVRSLRCLMATSSPQVVPTRRRDPERVPLYRFAGPRYWARLARARHRAAAQSAAAACAARRRPRCSAALHTSSAAATGASPRSTSRCACPNWSVPSDASSSREHFESLGCALIETGLVWWASDSAAAPPDPFRRHGASASARSRRGAAP